MRRVLAITLLLAGLGAFAFLAGGASDDGAETPKYWVELDNAFGLTEGSDFKIAGVRAGQIGPMKISPRSRKALVSVELNVPGFRPLKTDVYCQTRPQSLIGEYFIDCNPGTNETTLKPGSTIPVSRTFSTIPADVVNNILRLPQRQRLTILLNELGTGVGARADEINDVVRRAVPALHETDRLLKMLADENQTLTRLTENSDRVVGLLAQNRGEFVRFVREARDTSAASADRREAMAETFRRLPAFLAELRPTMVELGKVADGQIPTLRDLEAASGNLKRFLDALGPFSRASVPSLQSLAETARVGRETIPPASKTVKHLTEFTENAPELGKNLRIVLEDLYDRDRAVEPNPLSPGGKGFNGFEALVHYVWAQSQAINIFDRNGYILKVAVYHKEPCTEYHDDDSVEADPHSIEECASWLGPTQPGINAPDPSAGTAASASAANLRAQREAEEAQLLLDAARAAGPAPGSPQATGAASQPGSAPGTQPIDLARSLKTLVGGQPRADAAARQTTSDQSSRELLGYLFGP